MLVCLTGAGGKTSLMYALAKSESERGKRVLMTTSTHIFMPKSDQARWTDCTEELFSQKDQLYVYGSPDERTPKKLVQPEGADYSYLSTLADLVLCEADGAKGMPLKLPAEHEPVIPKECQLVIGLMGMQGFGKKRQEVCFRYEGRPELLADEAFYRDIMLSYCGLAKGSQGRAYQVVLGQADGELFDIACQMAESITKEQKERKLRYPDKIIVVSHKEARWKEFPLVQQAQCQFLPLY